MNSVMMFWFETQTIQISQTFSNPSSARVSITHICLSLFLSHSLVQYKIDPVSNTHNTLSVPLSVNCAVNKSVLTVRAKAQPLLSGAHTENDISVSFYWWFLETKHHFYCWLVILNKTITY